MNKLTKFLVKELLDEPKTVAIYGGGFKPPTKGHFHVVEKALEQYPEIDELKIFVGGGVRDGITQDESLQIWDIYKKHISDIIDVEPSVAPVKSVLGYAKENPDIKVYWILGAREGDEDDLKDIEERTKSLSKYPNIEVKVITTAGGVSGTKTRAAIKSDNKEQFFHLIPDVSDEEKEQIWDIVSPVIKENLITDIKSKIKKFILAVKQESKETKKSVSLLIKAAKGEIELTDEQKEQIGNQLKDVLKTIGLTALAVLPGGIIVATLLKIFKQDHLVTPSSFMNEVGEANLKPYKWEEVDAEGYYVYTRFVTDSETQYEVDIKSTVYFPPGQMDSVPALEIEFAAKPKGAEGSSAKIVVNKGEMYRVMATIVNIIKKYIKKSKAHAIIYSPSKKSSEENFGTQRDNLYRAFISKAFPGTTFKQSGDDVTAVLPNNAALTLDEATTATQVICDNCGWEWDKKDGGKDLYICHKCGHNNTPNKDLFGLNEFARQFVKEALKGESDPMIDLNNENIPGWEFKDYLLSLTKFMVDNGWNIQPFPKVQIINDDLKNASKYLGMTGFYNPSTKTVTLYAAGRHPKDIMRTYSHEMVHHMQNLENRLHHGPGTDVNKDTELMKVEDEAYEKGNTIFREWEDQLKEKNV